MLEHVSEVDIVESQLTQRLDRLLPPRFRCRRVTSLAPQKDFRAAGCVRGQL